MFTAIPLPISIYFFPSESTAHEPLPEITSITYDPVREVLSLDRSRSGYMYDILHKRDIQVKPAGGEVTLRILMDRFSVEIFINDGSQAATMVLFTPQEADNISFAADGKAQISVDKYTLTF